MKLTKPVVMILLALPVLALADEKKSLEVRMSFGGTSPQGAITGFNLLSDGSTTVTTLAIGGGVGFFTGSFEWMVSPSLTAVLSSGNLTVFSLVAGPVFNFGDDKVQDAFFVHPAIGLWLLSASGSSQTNFQFTVGFGKRFGLTESVAYAPHVSYTGITASSFMSAVSAIPLSFSILL